MVVLPVPSLTPCQAVAGCGGAQRREPTGGEAYGMLVTDRKDPPLGVAWILPSIQPWELVS